MNFVVLVEPEGAINVGMISRAMMNMDTGELVLVRPKCDHLSAEARNYSVHASSILESARVVPTLPEALEGADLSVAMTRRTGQWRKKDFWLEDMADTVVKSGGRTALVFGREQSGLTNEEIRACDLQCAIPSSKAFPSLNLAQSVMVTLYEIFKTSLKASAHPVAHAGRKDFDAMTEQMMTTFENLDFFKNTERERFEYYIKKILIKASLDPKDVQAVRGIFRRIDGITTGLKNKAKINK